jgi:hypothetical protein
VTGEQLPDDVRRLLLGAIPSVPHLEALMLLRDESGAWAASAVAKRIYVNAERATALLRDLVAQGLLIASNDAFTFAPLDPAARETVDRLAALYSRHVVEIARLLHAKRDAAAHEFADAFRLRKDT